MLSLILGRSGSGKTEYVRNLLGEQAKQGNDKLLLIVPEQFSYSSERALLEKYGSIDAQRIEVLSFSRLVDFVNRNVGGINGVKLDDSDKVILMTHALSGIQDSLEFYNLQADKTYFARDLIRLYSEFYKERVSLDTLKSSLPMVQNATLKSKLTDLYLIFNEYTSLLELNGYTDDDLLVTKLIDTLHSNNVFAGYTICIDAFKGFTGQEFEILSSVMRQANDVIITLCYDEEPEMTFGAVSETLNRLISIAKENNIQSEKTVLKNDRSNSEALRFLEKNIFSSNKDIFDKKTQDVILFEADTKYDECNFIAAKIRKYMREDSIRLRDIAIITRNEESYKNELVSALNRFEVPVFEDTRQPIATQPLIVLCKSLLNILTHTKLSTKDILAYLKTGLSPLSENEAAELENYVFTWNIKESDWEKDFTNNPGGIREEKDLEKLASLNMSRQAIITPILELKSVADENCKVNSLDTCKAIYDFLIKTGVKSKLLDYAKFLESTGFEALATEQNRVWEILMDILSKLGTIQGTDTIPATMFGELFSTVADLTTLGSIPHGLDEITIGSADRVRLSNPKVVFICGCIEGEFPQNIGGSNLLSYNDRKVLSNDLGITISPSNELIACDERFIAYQAVTSSTEEVIISYHKKAGASEALSPSCIYTDIKNRFSTDDESFAEIISSDDLEPYFFAETSSSTFSTFASGYKLLNDETASTYYTLRASLDGNENVKDKLESLDRITEKEPFKIKDATLAKEIFGNDIGLSPSRVETFFSCPFQYFCRYGIKVYPRQKAEFSSQLNGTVIHYAFEHMLQDYNKEQFENISDEELAVASKKYFDMYLKETFGDSDFDNPKFKYTYNKTIRNVINIAKRLREEFKVSSFEPQGFEHTVTDTIDAGDCKIHIKGDVDRIDIFTNDDGTKYLRVVDYKTYVKEFRLDHVVAGLNMQMLIYLFALSKNKEFGDVTPASVLYYKAKASGTTIDNRELSEEELANLKIQKNLSSGMYLNEQDVIDALESPESGNRFYSFVDGKGKIIDNLVTLEEIGQIEEIVNNNLCEMAHALHEGDIKASPAYYKNETVGCKYCDYSFVCGFEENTSDYNEFKEQKKSDILKKKDGDIDE